MAETNATLTLTDERAKIAGGVIQAIAGESARLRADQETAVAALCEPAARVLADFAPEDRPRVTVVERYEQSELPRLLAGQGVFLFPSPAEGCSLALLEAMAGGLTPVTTRTGYAADLIRPGCNGFLAEAGDIGGYTGAVLTLATDPAAGLRMGLRAQADMAGHSWPAQAEERVRIWDSLPPR